MKSFLEGALEASSEKPPSPVRFSWHPARLSLVPPGLSSVSPSTGAPKDTPPGALGYIPLPCPVEKWRGGSDSSRSGGFLIPSSIDEKGPQTKDANIEASPLQGRSGDMLSPRDPVASQSHPRLGHFVRSRGRLAGVSISKARALR